jgi:hypothetical protein
MTTTEVRTTSFNKTHALGVRLVTEAESLAALVARFELDAAGEPGDPEVTAHLDRVADLIGATNPCADLDRPERATALTAGRGR